MALLEGVIVAGVIGLLDWAFATGIFGADVVMASGPFGAEVVVVGKPKSCLFVVVVFRARFGGHLMFIDVCCSRVTAFLVELCLPTDFFPEGLTSVRVAGRRTGAGADAGF